MREEVPFPTAANENGESGHRLHFGNAVSTATQQHDCIYIIQRPSRSFVILFYTICNYQTVILILLVELCGE